MVSSLPGRGLRVGVAGVGFIGRVHIDSARAAGAQVVGISGGSAQHTQAIADDLGIDTVYASSEELAASHDIDVLHICTPNTLHAPLAEIALRSGKHVICEKPLATTVEDATRMVALASKLGLVATVPFINRFHPVIRDAQSRVANGESGPLRLIHGSYQQDWLANNTDYNWRVDPTTGGASQAFADIGTHWFDLLEFVSGHRVTSLIANTLTTIPERYASKAEAFSLSSDVGDLVKVDGEDAVTIMFKTDKGAGGSVLISQVSHGRKNRLWFEIDAENEAISFDLERLEQLWIGRRAAQEIVMRDPSQMSASAAPYAYLPVGHTQGWSDAFHAFVADTYRAVGGDSPEGLPCFGDGLRAAHITAAVLESSKDQSWKEVTK